VKKIRLQPKLISNVVNYTVVVDAVNQEHLLLPGMTAEVDFIIAEKKHVLLAPSAALQFKPPGETAGEAGSHAAGEDRGRLWFVDRNGRLAMQQVKTGVSDGSFTELIDAGALTEGMQVLCGVSSAEKDGKSIKNVNRLLMGDQAGPPPGPPPPGL
jgi:HlyD family secretion protein